MMVLVRRIKKYSENGLLIGVFNAYDRLDLFNVIDEFTDPYGTEYFIFPNCSGFLVNDITCKQFSDFFNNTDETIDFPKLEIENFSNTFFTQKIFDNDDNWHPLILDGEDMESWWNGRKKPDYDDEMRLVIGKEGCS